MCILLVHTDPNNELIEDKNLDRCGGKVAKREKSKSCSWLINILHFCRKLGEISVKNVGSTIEEKI